MRIIIALLIVRILEQDEDEMAKGQKELADYKGTHSVGDLDHFSQSASSIPRPFARSRAPNKLTSPAPDEMTERQSYSFIPVLPHKFT